jgi:hypothetical protein
MSTPDTTELHTALAALRAAVDAAVPRLPDPDSASERDARRRRLAWHLDEYLLPRVRDLDAPLVAVLIGSTGAGKSSLANGLAGRRVSPSGVTRPTTRRPAVLVAPADVEAFLSGRVLGRLAGEERLDMIVADEAAPGLALVDAPDVDSVEAANRQTADELLQAADLCLFVTTAQRYADAVPWDFLHRARERGVPLVVVMNRLPPDPEDRRAVLEDCLRRFEAAGLGTAGPAGGDGEPTELRILPVAEGERDPDIDGLRSDVVAPLRALLGQLAAEGPASSAVRRQALRGALEGLPGAVGAVAADLESDERRAGSLRAVVRRSYAGELAALRERMASGVFLRGEVMRAWQDFVGAGDVSRLLSTGLGRLKAWVSSLGGNAPATAPLEGAKEQAFTELTASLVRHADAAAGRVAEDWSSDPASARLLADRADLWGHGDGLPAIAHTELTGWLGRVTQLVQEHGRSKRAVAFAASVGVNAVGVATMLAVFAHTAGLTGGEVAIAGGTAVVNHKLLEALFGEAAVRGMVQAAEDDLKATLTRVLEADAERFLVLVAPAGVDAAELEAAAAKVEQAATAVAGA